MLGDGFMATFGAAVSVGNDCQHGLDAAIEIFGKLEQKNGRRYDPPIKIGMGLHYGPVVTGNVGSSIRKQYSITGQTVIIASRIEQLNKVFGSSLLISGMVLDHLDRKPVELDRLGPVPLKGLDLPL